MAEQHSGQRLDPTARIGEWARRSLEIGVEMDDTLFRHEFGRLYQEVGHFRRTRLNMYRFAQLGWFARLVVENGISGDYAEFGTWRGGSLYLVAQEWRRLEQSRRLYGFDSFEGLPEPDARDGHELYRGMFADNDYDETCAFFASRNFANVEIIRGWFDETIGRLEGERLALCHIDADCYESVRLALTHAYECVIPGGYIIFDDYRHPACSGCTIAVEEFFARRKEVIQQAPGIDCSAWVQKQA